MPNSIEPVQPPPMAGGAGCDDLDAPWPDERGEAEVIDGYSLQKHVPRVPFGPGEAPAGSLVLRETIPISTVLGSGPALPGMLLHPAIAERAS
eukprot:9917289-Alexandrium_andersonii.AAC.1